MADDVVVYSTPFCVPCDQLKAYLSERDVAFKVRDLMMDEEAAERLEKFGIRSTPALEVNGEIYAGAKLNPETIHDLLGVEARCDSWLGQLTLLSQSSNSGCNSPR